MNTEIRFVAYVLDLFPTGKIDPLSCLDNLNEYNFIETLKKNHVAIKFERNLETVGIPKEKFFYKFPSMKGFYQDMHTKIKKDVREFGRIKGEFSREGIKFLLIKSDGSFPHESDNLDILIKPDKLGKVVQLLKKEGYSELPQVREPHKFLFRKMYAPYEFPLHIHTRVEWEGTQFVDSQNLWSRHRIIDGNNGFLVPSPEDCILITTAHLFFENHEIKLDDLFKIDSCIRNWSVNWDYILDHAQRLHWNDAFHLTMLLLNLVYKDLSGRSLLPNSPLSKMEGLERGCGKPLLKIMKPSSVGPTPLRIPYALVGFFFVHRVLRDISLTLDERVQHLGFIASEVTKRKIRSA